jgi:signal transduction histidine kinase
MLPIKKNTPSFSKTKISEDSEKPALFTHLSTYLSRFTQLVSHLSISKKIAWGYTLALSVVVVGTVTGFTIGDYYQKQALVQREYAFQELRLLHSLKAALLNEQIHQYQLTRLTNLNLWKREYSHLLKQNTELQEIWLELKAYQSNSRYLPKNHPDVISQFLTTYEGVPEAYTQQLALIMSQVNLSNLQQEKILLVKQQLLNFLENPVALKLHNSSDNIERVVNISYENLRHPEAAIHNAESLRKLIIAIAILLSVGIAILLAKYTSQAIARPLQAVTNIAQTVTQESNFELQAPVTTADEVGTLATSLNQLIEQVNTLLAEQKAEASRQLIQSEKMSSLGRMIAGVAHEINNPVNFIYGNLQHTTTYLQDLFTLLKAYETKASDDVIQATAEEIDLEFLREDLPKLLQSMEMGATRAREIILSLKNFSRLDESATHPADLHACIDSTLLILNNRIKQGISIIKNYGELPTVEAYSGSLYQVFMNILSNAIDAVEEQDNQQLAKEIVITTQRLEENWVEIRITDNGPGISPDNQTKIFENFFTTKALGVGTGLGLSISYQIVVEKHCGRLTCESILGQGTTFAIALPIQQTYLKPAPGVTPVVALV